MRATHHSKTFHRADSVKDLLGQRTPALTRVSNHITRERIWSEFFARRLPIELTSHLSGIVEREAALVIFAESAVWCARLRFAVAELRADIIAARPTIQHVEVRVMPKT